MSDTIFTKIINRQIPADIIYEDDSVIAFLDIKPRNPGHTLVIPKNPSATFVETPVNDLANCISICQKIAKSLLKIDGVKGININCNNGEAAGQVIFHTHFHVIPRYENDGHKLWDGNDYKENEAGLIAKQIQNNL